MANLESLCKVRLSQIDDENALAFISNLRYIRRINLTPSKTKVKKSEVLVKGSNVPKRKVSAKTKQERLFEQIACLTPSQIATILNKGKDNTNG